MPLIVFFLKPKTTDYVIDGSFAIETHPCTNCIFCFSSSFSNFLRLSHFRPFPLLQAVLRSILLLL